MTINQETVKDFFWKKMILLFEYVFEETDNRKIPEIHFFTVSVNTTVVSRGGKSSHFITVALTNC